MSQLTIKAQITDLYEDRHGVAVRFGAIGEDGANDAWTGYAGPESSLRLEMTLSPEAVAQAGLTVNQRFTITFDLDGSQATITGPAESAEVEAGPHLVPDTENGGLTEVSAREARARGYDVAAGGAQGLAVSAQQAQPVLSQPQSDDRAAVDAQTGETVEQPSGAREADAYGATPDAGQSLAYEPEARDDAPHGEVHDPEDEAGAEDPQHVEAPALVTDRHDNAESA